MAQIDTAATRPNPHNRIKNVIKTLPRHPERTWSKRDRYGVNKIIVHQSLSDSTTNGVNNYHINPNHISPRGLPHIAYHYSIEKDGTIFWCNLIEEALAHTKGQNFSGVGVMLNGNFSGTGYQGKQDPTDEQLAALEFLLDYLVDFELADIGLSTDDVFGHSAFGKPACPGFIIDERLEEYRQGVREFNY